MYHTKIVNKAYKLNSSLDFYLLFENFITYKYKISYLGHHNSIFFILT